MPYNMYITEFVLYSDDVTIATDRPVVWTDPRALDSPVPDAGVKISGSLSTTASAAMRLTAYAATTDCGDDRAAWAASATETLDLGEVEPGASFAAYFTKLAKGKFFWRVFGTQGETTFVSQATVPIVTRSTVFSAKAYLPSNKEVSATVYDGSLADGNNGSYVVFDLRTLPAAWNIASLRVFPVTGVAFYRVTMNNDIKFGYETETTDWSSYVVKEIRGENDAHPTWTVSGLPEGITWQDQQEPLYTVYAASDDKVCELVFNLPDATRPDYLYVSCYNLTASELELRVLTDEPPPHVHDYGAWVTNKVVAVGVPGARRRTCSGCGSVETEALAPLPNATTTPREMPAKTVVLNSNQTLNGLSGWELNDGAATLHEDIPAGQHFPQCDFGEPRTISTMVLGTYLDSGNNERLRGCALQISDDGESWTDVYTIPSDYDFPLSSLVSFTIPTHAPARYARLYKNYAHNIYVTEFVLSSDNVMISADRPIVWTEPRSLASPVPAEGIRISGTLMDTAPSAMHLYAYAAVTNCGADHALWQAKAEATLDLGEIASGASFTNYFTNLRKGKHFWRVFGFSGDVVVASQPTVSFVTGGKVFNPKAYVATEGSAAAYDGKISDQAAGGSYAVFDLRALPENYDIAAMRVFTRVAYSLRATYDNDIKFGYETETTDWSAVITKEIRGADDAHPTWVVSGLPSGIAWANVQDPLYTTFTASEAAEGKVCELAFDLPKGARPAYLYVKMNRLSADEIELRALKQRKGLVLLVR